jgi:simple sugar transport system permease protein
MGIYYCVWDYFSNWTAFDGMLAALIAKNDIRKLPISAFILAALRAGALGMERFSGIPKSLVDTLIPIMIILIAMEGIYEVMKSFQAKKPNQIDTVKEGL